ncbi:response regulator transcription factor [Novosphingobium sp. AP12]|uniref:response regulator transcription factor n=1 Tax=Novosphingobium sp. AP12 TaxID=1144305 RepID=UPI0002721016|nr:response regulator transcription factor [Novosphingobium sp. AP12]EJL25396.1 response regulator with CheY-like receiver domain and winged-helix DNA-binding domain [Novosphingobium sp. AP12]
MRVLVVEDDPDVGEDLSRALVDAGYVVELVDAGDEAWFRGDTEDYAASILDLGLPRLDGLSVLRRWREGGRRFPVLILTARGDWTEKVEGIDAGADDYMAKPFAMGELIARLRGLIRRAGGHLSSAINVGRLTLDTGRVAAVVDGRTVRLSPLEYRFLEILSHRPGQPVATHEIAEHIYGTAEAGDTNAIEALVTRLRRKLGAGIIETRRGLGYMLADD